MPTVHPEKLLEKLFPPMLATLVAEPPAGEWIAEEKYDGFRAVCAISGGKFVMWSRNQLDLSDRFPAITHALPKLRGEAVLDGEAVVLDEEGASRFQMLQQGGAAVLFVFDLLWLDGRDLRAEPLETRRALLEKLLSKAPAAIRIAERIAGAPSQALDEAKRRKLEGVVLKRPGSRYENRRSRDWLKLKAQNAQELAIVGFTAHDKLPDHVGALLLGVVDNGQLRYAGKVGTGFSAAMRASLAKLLAKDAIERPASMPRLKDAVWVAPKHVAQVRFAEWTADGKLRHPAFLGLRDDKTPSETVQEKPAITIQLTNPDRVVFPDDGITKREVADYYAAVSGPMVRALTGRPISFEQWPKGIRGTHVYRQNLRDPQPWMTVVEDHLVVDRAEALAWLAQMNAYTVHMWCSRAPSLAEPDWVVFDFDPADGETIAQTIEPALALKGLLDELKLPSVPKTSGKRGLHVFVPLLPGHTHEEALGFAEHIGAAITKVLPQTTMERAKADRHGRLYFDVYQNGWGRTVVAPYSLRALDGAPVSAPLRWSEVGPALDPKRFTLRTMRDRLREVGDLWGDGIVRGARLPTLR
jgi:bifunctional non-homologous end joining protein LigD